MTASKDILRLANTIQSVNVVGTNLKFLKKKKKKSSDFIKNGTNNIVSSALIKEQSDFIEGF